MIAGREAVAHHEMSHKIVAEACGVGTFNVRVGENSGRVSFRNDTWEQVPGSQVALLAGHVGQMRWAREHGVHSPSGDSGDRAEFAAMNRDLVASGRPAVSYGWARGEAERLVARHWGAIQAASAAFYPAAQREGASR